MRILILNERDPEHPQAGGAETHVHEIFGRLVARGHAVTTYCSAFEGGRVTAERDGIQFERLGAPPFHYARAARACARATRSGDFDVVVDCLNKFPYLSPLYSRVPVLGLCHHLFGTTAFRQVAWPIATAVWTAERAIPRVFREARFVAISESTRDDLIRRGVRRERIEVQHPGIARPRCPALPIAEREAWIVHVGRLEAYKRVDWLLEVLAQLAPRHPTLRLAVLGRGREATRLAARAKALGLSERVRFEGFVSDAERDTWLARARACVCASTKEGFGLTVIEANALGTPNVATDAPGLRDTVRHGETGFLVATEDREGFARRIEELIVDDALAERFSAAALAWSQGFDWDRCADAMEQTLLGVVASPA